jgi:hypothetical protein
VKNCPHCRTPFPDEDTVCPRCGAEYWLPGDSPHPAGPVPPPPDDPGEGCASVVAVPLLTAFVVTAALILAGFVWNVLARFQSLSFRLMWLAGSCLAGIMCYRLIRTFREKGGENPPNHKGDMGS